MATLYLLRHGQTEFNLKRLVQGRCDSPLTELGRAQARTAGAWLATQGVHFETMLCSPLGRTRSTLDVVCGELVRTGSAQEGALPPVTFAPGIIERSYGPFEGGPQADVPADIWDPGEALIEFDGEGSVALRGRMVRTLTDAMDAARGDVLAVSHGSACLQFKQAWSECARCDQDVPLGNCCILVYEYDAKDRAFINTAIVNQ